MQASCTIRLAAAAMLVTVGLWQSGQVSAQQLEPPAQSKPKTSEPAASSLQVVEVGAGVSVTQSGRGRLLVVSDSWDFGFMPQNAKVTHRYYLQNAGDDTLFIEAVKPTCGCTSAPLSRDKLAPGEKVPVDVTFDSKTFNGSLTKHVNVVSSDKESPRYQLSFKAHVGASPAVGLEAGSDIRFQEIPVNEHRQARLPLVNLASGPVALRIADAPGEFLKASLSRESLPPREQAELVVETSSAAPLGSFHSSVTVEITGSQTLRLTIPITGTGITP